MDQLSPRQPGSRTSSPAQVPSQRPDPEIAEFSRGSLSAVMREAQTLAGNDPQKLAAGVKIESGPLLAALQKLHGTEDKPGIFAFVSKHDFSGTWNFRLLDAEGNIYGKSQYDADEKRFMNRFKSGAYGPTNEADQKLTPVVRAHGSTLEALGTNPEGVSAADRSAAIAAIEQALGVSGITLKPGNSLVNLDRSGKPVDPDSTRCQLSVMKGNDEIAAIVILKGADRPLVTLMGDNSPFARMMQR